jgi:hypothetical protein
LIVENIDIQPTSVTEFPVLELWAMVVVIVEIAELSSPNVTEDKTDTFHNIGTVEFQDQPSTLENVGLEEEDKL